MAIEILNSHSEHFIGTSSRLSRRNTFRFVRTPDATARMKIFFHFRINYKQIQSTEILQKCRELQSVVVNDMKKVLSLHLFHFISTYRLIALRSPFFLRPWYAHTGDCRSRRQQIPLNIKEDSSKSNRWFPIYYVLDGFVRLDNNSFKACQAMTGAIRCR